MPSYYSKLLPITQAHADYCYDPKPSKPLPFDESAPLACYRRPVDEYLKDVVHGVKKSLESLPKILGQSVFSVKIHSERGVEELRWELTIKKARSSLCYVRDALVVLHQNHLHSKSLLKHVEQILCGNQKSDADCSHKKLSEEDVKKLAKLKKRLLSLNRFLDCILLHYSSFSPGSLPSATEIKRTAKKINKAVSNLIPGSLKNMTGDRITEEDVLCSVLGLNDDLASRLKTVSEYMREHKTNIHHLMSFIRERDESDEVDLGNIEAVEQGLLKMGFSESRSNVITKWIAGQPFPQHRSLLTWAQIYIANQFKYDVFLNDEVKKFPFNEDAVNKWFEWKLVDGEREDDDKPVPELFVINTTTKEDALAEIAEKKAKLEENNPEEKLYYHGTDHKSVLDILKCGIQLATGTKKCDFSKGYGFYVADDFEYALTEHAMSKQYAALIMFRIGDDCLKKGLDLSGPEKRKDLRAVVDYFRSGGPKNHKLEMTLYNSIKNCHYIFGPVSRDGKDGDKSNVNQICIRNEEMADKIGDPSHIVGTVFLNTRGDYLA